MLISKVIAFLNYLFVFQIYSEDVTVKRSVNWFVHKKARREPAEALEGLLLQNRKFVNLLSSELQNTSSSDFISPCPSTGHLGHNLERCQKLLRRLPRIATKNVFFTDEKNFYLNTPVNNLNNHVWGIGKKQEVDENRLLVQRSKSVPHVMVSAGICFNGKGRFHFISEKAKLKAKLYIDILLQKLVTNWQQD